MASLCVHCPNRWLFIGTQCAAYHCFCARISCCMIVHVSVLTHDNHGHTRCTLYTHLPSRLSTRCCACRDYLPAAYCDEYILDLKTVPPFLTTNLPAVLLNPPPPGTKYFADDNHIYELKSKLYYLRNDIYASIMLFNHFCYEFAKATAGWHKILCR